MSNTSAVTTNALTLTVISANGQSAGSSLEEGASLIVGQGANCGLKLIGESISPMHCILRFQDGQLHVQDWCSESGTYVDGVRIEDEVSVDPGSKLKIGNCEIHTKAGNEDTAVIEQQPTDLVQQPQSLAIDENDPKITSVLEDSLDVDSSPVVGAAVEEASNQKPGRRSVPEIDEIVPGLSPLETSAEVEDEVATDNTASLEPPTNWRRSSNTVPLPTSLPVDLDGGFAQETVDLLQQELEYLQAELVERDNRIAEFQQLVEGQETPQEVVGQAETEALVQRLEGLIDELDRSDQRLRTLEELLLAEQQVSQAERDERTQLEGWLSEIENRISERESEGQAEREVLTRRIHELNQQLAAREQQLCEAANVSSAEKVHETALGKLRDENESLNKQLVSLQQEYRQLEAQFKADQNTTDAEKQKAMIESALREERMTLAQERASLSRERAEMARKLAEVQEMPKPSVGGSAADERFNAFRQTLKELHKEEGRDAVARKATLGSRIADLWKRLDGPTDTD